MGSFPQLGRNHRMHWGLVYLNSSRPGPEHSGGTCSWIFFEKSMNEFWSFYLPTTWLVPRSTQWSQRSHNHTGCTLAGSFRERLLGGGHDSSLYFAQWLRDISKRTENCLKVFTVALCSTWISLRSERFASAWSKDAHITRTYLCRPWFLDAFGKVSGDASQLRSGRESLHFLEQLAWPETSNSEAAGEALTKGSKGVYLSGLLLWVADATVSSCILLSLPGTRHWWEISCPAALLRLCT